MARTETGFRQRAADAGPRRHRDPDPSRGRCGVHAAVAARVGVGTESLYTHVRARGPLPDAVVGHIVNELIRRVRLAIERVPLGRIEQHLADGTIPRWPKTVPPGGLTGGRTGYIARQKQPDIACKKQPRIVSMNGLA